MVYERYFSGRFRWSRWGYCSGLPMGVGRYPTNSIGWGSAMKSQGKERHILDLHIYNSWSTLSTIS